MDNTYSITKNAQGHIGYAVIINNFSFKTTPRLDTDKDVENIKLTLGKLKFFVCEPEFNLKAEQIKSFIRNMVKLIDFSQYSCLAIVIMSHGDTSGKIFGVDNESVNLDKDIIGPFKNCEGLQYKPKLFFVQACRGRYKTQTIEMPEKIAGDKVTNLSEIVDKEKRISEQKIVQGDILIHSATAEKYVTLKNVIQGSCFIQSLCNVFNSYVIHDAGECFELDKLIRMVNYQMVNKYKCTQPEYRSSLKKKFFFNSDPNE
jgi:hypothetical protein